jgi:hypothetical protein
MEEETKIQVEGELIRPRENKQWRMVVVSIISRDYYTMENMLYKGHR